VSEKVLLFEFIAFQPSNLTSGDKKVKVFLDSTTLFGLHSYNMRFLQ